MNKKSLTVILVVIIIALLGWIFYKPETTPIVMSFADCAKVYPVMESYPRQCKTPDGRTYAEEIALNPTYINASADMIKITNPYPGAVTGKTFTVTGEARGTWYFEGSFTIELLDKNSKRLAIAVAQAEGEWMTENFVPFKAEIKVPENYIGPATLILNKDNPSDMREHDASVSFPITVEY